MSLFPSKQNEDGWYIFMRIIVGVTGASGVIMSYHLLKALRQIDDCEIHLIVSEGGKKNWDMEVDMPFEALTSLADVVHSDKNMAATISSGSYKTDGMIVIPCSMKTLAGVAAGYAENLIVRSVDVCLKENRKVVLVTREMPFSKVHLRNMKEAADNGCAIVSPVLTFYNGALTLVEQINHVVGKVMMQFGIDHSSFVPWAGADENGIMKYHG